MQTSSSPSPAKAKLFMNGRSQAVRLPKAFRLPGKEVWIRQVGDELILQPMVEDEQPWEAFRASLKAFSGEFFSAGRQQLPMQERDFA